MKTKKTPYSSSAIGCMIGCANQILLSQLENALRDAALPLTPLEYLVLRAIYSQEGLQQCEIADMVGRDRAGVCRAVSALVKKGLVATQTVSYKCMRVYLTDKSRAMEPKVLHVADSRHQALLDLVGTEKFEVFNEVLQKIIKSK